MTLRINFARWRSDAPSGGNRYDAEVIRALRELGADVREHAVSGTWPFPLEEDRASFRSLLMGDDRAEHTGTADGDHWIVGNIVGSAAPDVIRQAEEADQHVSLLMHYFAADDASLPPEQRARIAETEAQAVAAASTIIATSAWTAAEVERRYGRSDVVVAQPGVRPADIAPGSVGAGRPPSLLWLARLTPAKDPLTLIAALGELRDLDWRVTLVGPDTVDEHFTREVHTRIAELDLEDRVRVLGTREGAALDAIWARTDLLVHTSRAEAYGMVVTEALARGIPSIVPATTGAVEAQHGAGGSFLPGDPQGLARDLRRWLTDPAIRADWRERAIMRRETLPTWADTANSIASAIRSQ